MAGLTKVKGSGLATGAATDSLVGIADNATSTKLTISDTNITGVGAFTSTSIDATKLSGALPAIDGSALTGMPAGGKVLQVVQATDATQINTSLTTSEVDLPLLGTITPTSSSSKILVMLTTWMGYNPNGGVYLKRGSTKIGGHGLAGNYNTPDDFWCTDDLSNVYAVHSISYTYLDTPNTTSATTYRIGLKNGDGMTSGEISYNRAWNGVTSGGGRSTITLMEIGV